MNEVKSTNSGGGDSSGDTGHVAVQTSQQQQQIQLQLQHQNQNQHSHTLHQQQQASLGCELVTCVQCSRVVHVYSSGREATEQPVVCNHCKAEMQNHALPMQSHLPIHLQPELQLQLQSQLPSKLQHPSQVQQGSQAQLERESTKNALPEVLLHQEANIGQKQDHPSTPQIQREPEHHEISEVQQTLAQDLVLTSAEPTTPISEVPPVQYLDSDTSSLKSVAKRKSSKRSSLTSPCWEYFKLLESPLDDGKNCCCIVKTVDGEGITRECNALLKVSSLSDGTSNILRHLKSRHPEVYEKVLNLSKRSNAFKKSKLSLTPTSPPPPSPAGPPPMPSPVIQNTCSISVNMLMTEEQVRPIEPSRKPVAKGIVDEMIQYINSSLTPFHAVEEARKLLSSSGFNHISEKDNWSLVAGGKYFFTRNYSSIIAFAIGNKYNRGDGCNIISGFTDSPCLKLKPISKGLGSRFLHVDVQACGNGSWYTWLDRDLSVAGRIIVKKKSVLEDNKPFYVHKVLAVRQPIMRIPSSPTLTTEEINYKGMKINDHDLMPLLATSIKESLNKPVMRKKAHSSSLNKLNDGDEQYPLLMKIIADDVGCEIDEICDFELFLFDTQSGSIGGAFNEFVFSSRLNHHSLSFCALKALIDSSSDLTSLENESSIRVVALFDHLKYANSLPSTTFSSSYPLVEIIKRITSNFSLPSFSSPNIDYSDQAIQKSFLVQVDPSFCLKSKEETPENDPYMHHGLIVRVNESMISAFLFKEIAKQHGIPVQDFGKGSEILMTAHETTVDRDVANLFRMIRGVNVGISQLSMNSVREMCGVDDVHHAYAHFVSFFQELASLDSHLKID